MTVKHANFYVGNNALPFLYKAAKVAKDYSYFSKNDLNAMGQKQLTSFVEGLIKNYDKLPVNQKDKVGQIIRQADKNKKAAVLKMLAASKEENAKALIEAINKGAATITEKKVESSNEARPLILHPVEYMTPELVDTIFVSSNSWNKDDKELAARRAGELNDLFKLNEESGEREVGYDDLRSYLLGQAGWKDQAVIMLFGRSEKITRDQFVKMIRKNVLTHNEKRSDAEYCESIGVKTGTIFQLADSFYRIDSSQARSFIGAVEDKYGNAKNSEIGRIIRRAKASDGDPKNWSDREIITAYLALAMRYKEEVINDTKGAAADDTEEQKIGITINHRLLCEKYGINENEEPDTREVKGRLEVFEGEPTAKGYLAWNKELTNDDWFAIRNSKGKPVPELGNVDVKSLWIENKKNTKTGMINAVTKIKGVYYKITIHDNVKKKDRKELRYINGSKSNTEALN